MAQSYRAFVVEQAGEEVKTGVVERPLDQLAEGEVTIRVAYSSVNYKDGLATLAKGGVVRRYPLVPGIDLAGTVTHSRDPRFREGDQVLVTGYDLGVAHDGGFAEFARVPVSWAVKLPRGLSPREAMAYGTAGFTAALAIRRLEDNGLKPAGGPILVTGASGGVGSLALAMLAKLGYTVAASTGKTGEHDYLKKLGANQILSRDEVSAEGRPLGQPMWAGAIDQVGGTTLAWVLSTMAYRGLVAATGLTGGAKLPTTVLPFILRGVSLLGVDSVMCPMTERIEIWQRLAGPLKPARLGDLIAHETTLEDLPKVLASILKGGVRGRTIVKIG